METYRPTSLDGYIGQEVMRRNLEIAIKAAKNEKRPVNHVLIYGAPGTGKSTIAVIIANIMGAKLHRTTGPALDSIANLVSFFRNVKEGDVVFIDEIHGLPRPVEESLYLAMEDRVLYIIAGNQVKMNLTIPLPHFTVVGATTLIDKVSKPLFDRFGSVYHLEYYSDVELTQILNQANLQYQLKIEDGGLEEIAKRSRGTPRIALKLLRNAGDYASAINAVLTRQIASDALEALQIDELGLNESDREYLNVLIRRYGGNPAGISAIASVMNRREQELESFIEPWLLKCGFIDRTPRGRIATPEAYKHLGIEA